MARRRHSVRTDIREAIRRRQMAGEPLSVRAIRNEVGGSHSTIQEELAAAEYHSRRLGPILSEVARKNPAEQIRALKEALDSALAREIALETEAKALRETLAKLDGIVKYALDRSDHTYRTMITEVDQLRQASTEASKREPVVVKVETEKVAFVPDEAAKAKYDALAKEFVKATERIRELEGKLAENGLW